MNILDKICFGFLVLVIGTSVLFVLGVLINVMWKFSPILTIVMTLSVLSLAYLSRDLDPPM